MATQTAKLGFNTWLPSDYMNVSELNANFNKLDNYIMCTKSEVISTTASNGENTSTDWLYREYSDGTAELCAAVTFTKLKCDVSSGGETDAAPYYSPTEVIHFPKTFSEIYSLQLTVGGGMVMCDDSSNFSRSYVSFSIAKFSKDITDSTYLVYVDIKGKPSAS